MHGEKKYVNSDFMGFIYHNSSPSFNQIPTIKYDLTTKKNDYPTVKRGERTFSRTDLKPMLV
jgi:hypothetical protein